MLKTTAEVAEMLGMDFKEVINFQHRNHINVQVGKKDGHRVSLWDDMSIELVRQWRIKKESNNNKAPVKTLEELRAEHPLVIDDRCFNINWWPDVEVED